MNYEVDTHAYDEVRYEEWRERVLAEDDPGDELPPETQKPGGEPRDSPLSPPASEETT